MNEQDTMKLVAEIVDKYSGPLKEMQRALKATAASTKGIHASGAAQARAHTKALREMHERIEKTRAAISGAFTPAMAALGLTTFGVGEAISSVVEKLKAMGAQYNVMTDASRRAGMSVDTIRGLAGGFERLGISQDIAVKSAAEFGEHMDKLKRNDPEELTSWGHKLAGAYQALGDQLRNIPTRSGQLDAVFNFFSTRPNISVDQKRKFYEEILHLPPELATKTGEELRDALQKGFKYAAEHPYNAELAKNLSGAFIDLKEALHGFDEDMVETFGGRGVKLVNGFADSITRISQEFRWWGEFLGKWSEKLGVTAFIDRPYFDKNDPKHLWKNNNQNPFASGDDKKSQDNVAKGVRQGTLDAFKEYFNTLTTAEKFAGGYTPMAYHPDGGDAVDGSRSGGAGRGWGGGGYKALGDAASTKAFVDKITAKDKADNSDASLNPGNTPAGGSISGGFDRSGFAKELADNPALKEKVFQLSAGEDRPSSGSSLTANQAVMETMMNRARMRGTSLAAQAKWYGRESGGYYAGRPSNLSAHERAMSEANLKAVLGGSNITDYATDNSSGGLAAREKASGKFIFHKNFHGESFFSPGWAEPHFRDRYAKMRRDIEEATRTRDKPESVASGEQKLLGSHRALMRDHIRGHGHKTAVEGNLGVTVDFGNMPKGTRTAAKYDGMFSKVTLNRGRQMETASETS